jgi:hypothetical protein
MKNLSLFSHVYLDLMQLPIRYRISVCPFSSALRRATGILGGIRATKLELKRNVQLFFVDVWVDGLLNRNGAIIPAETWQIPNCERLKGHRKQLEGERL